MPSSWFFFSSRRRHTRWPRDWSSDVCSSDLAVGAAALVDVALELLAEPVHVARDRHRGRVAERAEALAEDPVADVEQQVELVLRRLAVLDRAQRSEERRVGKEWGAWGSAEEE